MHGHLNLKFVQFHLMCYVIVQSPPKFKQSITKIKYGGNC